jgi:L-rhamnose mutarotase
VNADSGRRVIQKQAIQLFSIFIEKLQALINMVLSYEQHAIRKLGNSLRHNEASKQWAASSNLGSKLASDIQLLNPMISFIRYPEPIVCRRIVFTD